MGNGRRNSDVARSVWRKDLSRRGQNGHRHRRVVYRARDRHGFSPRIVTAGVGAFFILPGLFWFLTQRWWDRKSAVVSLDAGYRPSGERQKMRNQQKKSD